MRAPLTRYKARGLPDRSDHRCYPTRARQSRRTEGVEAVEQVYLRPI